MKNQLKELSKDNVFAFSVERFPLEGKQKEFRVNVIGLADCFPLSPEHYDKQECYIRKLFLLINPFCKYYELDDIFFYFLTQAASRLKELSTCRDREERLPEYFEKIAMIFQIAADKTESSERKTSFVKEAQEYIKKSDAVRSELSPESFPPLQAYKKRMPMLFQAAANDDKMPEYNKPYFKELAAKYSDKPKPKKITTEVILSKLGRNSPRFVQRKETFSKRKDGKPYVRQRFDRSHSSKPESDQTPLLVDERSQKKHR